MEKGHIAGTAVGTAVKIVIAVVIVLYVYRFAVTAYDYGYRIFGETPVAQEPGEEVTVAILEGTGVKQIGKILEQKGLIRDAGLFYWQEKFSSHAGEIKPGAYELNTSMTAEQMMTVMSAETETESATEEQTETRTGEDAGDGTGTQDGTQADAVPEENEVDY